MSRLRIALIAPPWITVPPRDEGGIDRVIELLGRELLRRGHDLTVFACQGSDPALKVVELADQGWFDDVGTPDQRVREATYLRRVHSYVKSDHFDVVHEHTEYPGIMVAHSLGVPFPVVATIHGRVGPKESEFLREVDQEIGLVAISDAQRAASADVHWDAVVPNVVDVGVLADDYEAVYELALASYAADFKPGGMLRPGRRGPGDH